MKKIDLGQTVQMVANFGVIGGLIFLGLEISQNTTQLSRGEMNATMEQYSSWRHTIAANVDLAEVWGTGHRDLTSLSATEQIRFELMLADSFWLNYQFWDRAQVGAISLNWGELALQGTENMIAESAASRRWWEEHKSTFPLEFVVAVESGL